MIREKNYETIAVVGRTLLLTVALGATLLTAAGCAVFSPQPNTLQEKQATMEKLINNNSYQRALLYLQKTETDNSSEAYQTQYQRLIQLIYEYETAISQEAIAQANHNDLLAAVTTVKHGLLKVPESSRLTALKKEFEQERDKRLAEAERNILLSKAEYLASQLEGYEEQALLSKTSFFTRWQISGMETSLAALRPKLMTCGIEALAANQTDIAERCLHLAMGIEASEEVNRLLDKARAETDKSSIVPISEAKKTRPPSLQSASFHELEEKLRQEIARGEIINAYVTLAKLEQFSDAAEQSDNYREQLDRDKAERIAAHLEEGAGLYRNGKIAEARDAWLQVLELDENNYTANEKIARADKVLKKLHSLQDSQHQITPEK